MPIYEYRCENCGHQLEALQKISDDELKQCPECDQPRLQRLISPVGFRLKGSGWYETDFKSGEKRNLYEGGDKKANTKKAGDSKPAGDNKADKKTGSTQSKNSQSASAA